MARYLWVMTLAAMLGNAALQAQSATSPMPPTTSAPATTQRTITISLPKAAALPASPGFFTLPTRVKVDDREFPMTVGLFLPPAYFQSSKPFPVVMMLHNKGLEGLHGDLGSEGLAALCSRDDWDWRTLTVKPGEPTPPPRNANAINLRTQAQFIGIAPQCPRGRLYGEDPMPAVLVALIDQVAKLYRTDQTRVYLTGFSYGGTCTWQIAEQMPERFAAIVPLSTRATDDPARTAQALNGMGVYVTCGTNEWSPPFCRQMRDALVAAGHPRFVYHEFEGGTHWCYPMVYTDPQFWDWLFAQQRTIVAKGAGAGASAGTAKRP